jgi:hypothetical protein
MALSRGDPRQNRKRAGAGRGLARFYIFALQ